MSQKSWDRLVSILRPLNDEYSNLIDQINHLEQRAMFIKDKIKRICQTGRYGNILVSQVKESRIKSHRRKAYKMVRIKTLR